MTPVLAVLLITLAAAAAPAAGTQPPPDPAAGAQAPAQTPVSQTVPLQKPLKNDDDKVVCVSEAQTGTLFKTRTCMTKAEWRKKREHDREKAAEALDPRTASTSTHTE